MKVAECAAIRGIGKFRNIQPIRPSVALKEGEEAQSFACSRTWTAPRTILHFSSGRLAIKNIRVLVADDDLSTEDWLIGLPVLQHRQIDTKTLLEIKRSVLDGTVCALTHSGVNPGSGGYVSRLMITRLNRLPEIGVPPEHDVPDDGTAYQTRRGEKFVVRS